MYRLISFFFLPFFLFLFLGDLRDFSRILYGLTDAEDSYMVLWNLRME